MAEPEAANSEHLHHNIKSVFHAIVRDATEEITKLF